MKSTNYYDTFIEVAEDCPVTSAAAPPRRGTQKTVATIQFEMISASPYTYTSDDVLFAVHRLKHEIGDAERDTEREKFFSRGQPCLRSSPLTKRYGWGVHSDAQGRVALYAVESEEYETLVNDDRIEHTRAMRSRR